MTIIIDHFEIIIKNECFTGQTTETKVKQLKRINKTELQLELRGHFTGL